MATHRLSVLIIFIALVGATFSLADIPHPVLFTFAQAAVLIAVVVVFERYFQKEES